MSFYPVSFLLRVILSFLTGIQTSLRLPPRILSMQHWGDSSSSWVIATVAHYAEYMLILMVQFGMFSLLLREKVCFLVV